MKEREVTLPPMLAAILGFGPGETAIVGEHLAMNLSSVYRAVSIISGSIASLPLTAVEPNAAGDMEPVASMLDNPGGSMNGQPMFSPFEWKELITIWLLLHGNVYLQHIRNGAGALVGLHPIHPWHVNPYWDWRVAGGKRFEVNVPGDSTTPGYHATLDASSMTQIMGLTLDGLRGISVLAHARLSLSTALAGDKAAHNAFVNGAMISGMVTPAGDDDLVQDAERDEPAEVRAAVERSVTGVDNAGGVAVFSRKLAFSPWQLSAVDAQFLESRTFQVDEVGRWFGIPSFLLGLTEKATSWGTGIAEQNRGLARYTLQPWTSRIAEKLTTVLSAPTRCAEFDYDSFVRPAPEDFIALVLTQVNGGLITANEGRKLLNLPAVPGGDVLRLPPGSAPPVAAPVPVQPAPQPEGAAA